MVAPCIISLDSASAGLRVRVLPSPPARPLARPVISLSVISLYTFSVLISIRLFATANIISLKRGPPDLRLPSRVVGSSRLRASRER